MPKKKILPFFLKVILSVCIAYSLFGIGFFCVISPAATGIIGNTFSNWEDAVYPKEDMQEIAESVRAFSVGSISEEQLKHTVLDVAFSNHITDKEALESEIYVLSDNAISHLSDCIPIFQAGLMSAAIAIIISIAGIIFMQRFIKKDSLSHLFIAGSSTMLVILIGLGVWGILDFDSLFTKMHEMLFTGNWLFYEGSLLIQLFPENFWMAMAATWLSVSVISALILLILGIIFRTLQKRSSGRGN